MALCVFFFAVGAAAAGVGVASYFTWKVDRVEASLNSRIDTITRVPLTDNSPTASTPGNKTDLAGSIFRVRTLTELGNPDTASAFVATTDGTRVFLLTSLDKLRRATWDSEVTLAVTNGGPEVKASMWSWDEKTKMAVLVANIPGLARIPWVTAAERPGVGASVTIPGVAKPLTIAAIDGNNVTLDGDITGAVAGAPVLAGAKVLAVVTVITPGQAIVAPLVTQSCGSLFDCTKLNG